MLDRLKCPTPVVGDSPPCLKSRMVAPVRRAPRMREVWLISSLIKRQPWGRGSARSHATRTSSHQSQSHFADECPHVGGVGGKAHPKHNGILLANKLSNGTLQLLDNGKIA